jgi:hypothetical protein
MWCCTADIQVLSAVKVNYLFKKVFWKIFTAFCQRKLNFSKKWWKDTTDKKLALSYVVKNVSSSTSHENSVFTWFRHSGNLRKILLSSFIYEQILIKPYEDANFSLNKLWPSRSLKVIKKSSFNAINFLMPNLFKTIQEHQHNEDINFS